jgi:nitrogenase-associated protein
MAVVTFYEKPGCANNTRQKQLLSEAGHQVLAYSLLTEPWTKDRLRAFFQDRPVAEWFNRAAPKVKSGEVVPEQVTAEHALALMLAEPLLIRRPLMEVGNVRMIGFEQEKVDAWIGLSPTNDLSQDVQTCRKQTVAEGHHANGHHGCAPPKT